MAQFLPYQDILSLGRNLGRHTHRDALVPLLRYTPNRVTSSFLEATEVGTEKHSAKPIDVGILSSPEAATRSRHGKWQDIPRGTVNKVHNPGMSTVGCGQCTLRQADIRQGGGYREALGIAGILVMVLPLLS